MLDIICASTSSIMNHQLNITQHQRGHVLFLSIFLITLTRATHCILQGTPIVALFPPHRSPSKRTDPRDSIKARSAI